MTIKTVEEPDIYLTLGEIHRYRQEYEKAFSMYAGPVPTFEDWVRGQIARKEDRDNGKII